MRRLIFLLTIIFMIYHASATVAAPLCDPGWIPYNDWCYFFSKGRPVQWQSAQNECNVRDAGLLRLYSQADLNWVVGTASNRSAMGYWTALNDNPKPISMRYGNGRWKWGFNEIANMSLINWNRSPANDGTSNCMGINLLGNAADVICSAKQGYICSISSGGNGCPLGWIFGDYNCYWVSNTTDRSQLLNWNDAMSWCINKQQGATLLIINNSSDTNFLYNQLPYLAKTTKIHWTGLKYNTQTTQWGWYNNAPFNQGLVLWKVEPDNVAGIENCGVLRKTGTFSDRDCSTQSNYICMKSQPIAFTANNLGCGTWIRAGQQCYGFETKNRLAWQDARGYCKNVGGDLVKLDTFDKQSWLTQQLSDPINDHTYWTGLNDIANEGQYVWGDGSTANQTFINWNHEPNNYKGQEDCALIYTGGQYNDVMCAKKAAAICEINGASTCPDTTWTKNGNSCYQFTPYNNKTVLYTQLEAATYCSSFAPSSTALGALVSINDANEKAFITKSVASLPDNSFGWWTSLNDRQEEGFWSFGDGSSPDFVDWNGGEPSTVPSDDCGQVQFEGAFHERNCNNKMPFICERYAAGYSSSPVTKAGSVLIACGTMIAMLLY